MSIFLIKQIDAKYISLYNNKKKRRELYVLEYIINNHHNISYNVRNRIDNGKNKSNKKKPSSKNHRKDAP